MTRQDRAAKAATQFREDNNLGIAPIADLVALIEQTQDVDVTVLDVDDSNEHGLTMVDPQRNATIVAVARSEKPMRWRSTLAHELGHLIFNDHKAGEPARLVADTSAEDRAQTFARHLLLPVGAVKWFVAHRRGAVGGKLDEAAFSDLVQLYQVSPAVAAIQLSEGHHIDPERFEVWRKIYTPSLAARFGWMDHYQALQMASRQRRSPQRLLARTVAGYVAGVVTLETLAGVRGVDPADLATELRAAGIAPNHEAALGASPAENLPDAGEFVDLAWLDD